MVGASMTPADSALSVRGVSKRFGNTRALRSVDFTVEAGTVHALLGHNGSGKSTLIKILAGYYQQDEGVIAVGPHELPPHHNPRQAHAAGLRFVHQDLGLVPTLSVAENLALDVPYESDLTGTIRWHRQYAAAIEELDKLELDVDPRRNVDSLGPVEQTMVAVARALQGIDYDRSVLFLDEPTARLPRSEVDRLLAILGTLKRRGVAVVYVTHRLDEVFVAADVVTILRDGERVFSAAVRNTDEAAVSKVIIGHVKDGTTDSEADTRVKAQSSASADAVATLTNVSGRRVRDVSLRIFPGEIVAVTGLVGSGRSELGRLLSGIQPLAGGTVSLGQREMRKLTPRRCKAAGLGYSPQDRGQGLVSGLGVGENLAVTSYFGLSGLWGISKHRIGRMAQGVISRLSIRPPDPEQVVDTLSGGNQQKVALGKWLRKRLALLILDEPLQGIDVGAKSDIMRAIRTHAEEDGLAVLWMESDIQEVSKYADRTLVMRDGRLSVELPGHASKETLLAAVYDRNYAAGSERTLADAAQEITA
jgi:ribose transport system ATP-binding protein